jgi:hypothetical protein
MSEARFTPKGGILLRLLGSPVRAAYLGSVIVFLWCVGQFYHPGIGFTAFLSIGDQLGESKVTALRQVPHYIYESSPGYDGAYYVQLALYPTLDNPELKKAIDNLPYRARRILFSWTAWALGLGQPAWIVQAHALLNVVCWLALGWALLRWFPATSWGNFLRWLAVMFSHGVIMSVRHSLVDGPSLLLVALALRWLEDGKRGAGAVTLALAGLGKETVLLSSAGLDFDWRAPRTWGRTLVTVLLVVLPLAAWMLFIKLKFGPADDPGMGNFTLPLAGFVEKWRAAWSAAFGPERSGLQRATLAVALALAVQWLFFIVRWRPQERWWRVGVVFAAMATFLSTPVWEGFPGAATRVLLPMTLAFNVLVPRGGRWLAVLVAGNLTVAASVFEFSPPHEFYQMRGERTLRAAVRVLPSKGWHGPERHLEHIWRWSTGRSELRVINDSGQPVQMILRGQVTSAEGMRTVRVMLGERLVWSDTVGQGAAEIRFGIALPPGETVLTLSSAPGGQKVGTDPRDLAFQLANLDIVVQRAGVPR